MDIINNQIDQALGMGLKKNFRSALHYGFSPESTARLLIEAQKFFSETIDPEIRNGVVYQDEGVYL